MSPELQKRIEQVASVMVRAQRPAAGGARRGAAPGGTVALTGAGISVESGIPDFRSPGGLWERFDPMEYATIEAFQADPRRVWKMLAELDQVVASARPNPGHLALARLELSGVLSGVITQNVDNLHQAAGSRRVVEFHGNGSRLVCPGCGVRSPAAAVRQGSFPPTCDCGRVLKPDVVLFGELIPEAALRGATELIEHCRVLLVVGTSATVAPASLFPLAARRAGAFLVEVNVGPTELSRHCDVVLHAPASASLPALADQVERLLGGLVG